MFTNQFIKSTYDSRKTKTKQKRKTKNQIKLKAQNNKQNKQAR